MSRPPAEDEELRAALEEQLRTLQVPDVVIQTAVTLINLAGRRLGLGPGTEGERDLAQVRDAIDAVRGLLPVLERGEEAEALRPLRDALAQLQLEYAKLAQPAAPGSPAPPAGESPPPGDAAPSQPGERRSGPAESSGRLWVPGR